MTFPQFGAHPSRDVCKHPTKLMCWLLVEEAGRKTHVHAGMSEVELLFNIVKNIVGEGMLSLPAGIAGGTGTQHLALGVSSNANSARGLLARASGAVLPILCLWWQPCYSEAGSLIAAAFSVLMGYTFSIMGRTCYATGSSLLRFAFPCVAHMNGPTCCVCKVNRATRTVQQKSRVLAWLKPWRSCCSSKRLLRLSLKRAWCCGAWL